MPALKRIGHKGADLIAPGNTLASFDAALAAGVDMVEFDVLTEHRDGTGRLVLAHDFEAAAAARAADPRAGSRPLRPGRVGGHRARRGPQDTGYEQRVVDALREYGLAERALISTMEEESLPVVRAARARDPPGLVGAEAAARLPGQPVHARAGARRRAVHADGAPGQAARAIGAGRIDAVMSHWALVTRAWPGPSTRAGGELYVWTVDDRCASPSSTRSG